MMKDDFNALSDILNNIKDGDIVELEQNKTYNVYQENCYRVNGYYCSNTATYEENPSGERFSAIYIKGKKNIVINGNGATILCHGIFTPIIVDCCKNITIKNLTVDYARPTMSETYVKEFVDGVYKLEFSPETLFETDGNELYFVGEKDINGKPYFKFPYKGETMLSMALKNRKLTMMKGSKGDARPSFPTFKTLQKTGEREISVTLNGDDFLPVDAIIQTRSIIRDQLGGFFERCDNVKLLDCKILAMHGFGFMFQFVKDITVENMVCMPKNGRTSVSNADMLQFMNCGGTVTIKGGKFEGAHDDFINIHGTYLKVISANGKKCLVRFMHPQTHGFKAYEIGDEIAFVDATNYETYKKSFVTGFTKISDTDIEVEFTDDVTHLREDTVAENLTWSPKVIIKNNYFGYNAAHGILCSVPKEAVISENVFDGNSMNPLSCGGAIDFWYESGISFKLEFSNNTVKNGLYGFRGEGTPAIRFNVFNCQTECKVKTQAFVFENNKFNDCYIDKYIVEVKHVCDFVNKNNSFDKPVELIVE